MKHVHSDLIKVWADGAEIQFRSRIVPNWTNTGNPSWRPDFEYRIKPQQTKYRLYAYRRWDKSVGIALIVNENDTQRVENSNSFIKWITDWCTYEHVQTDLG